MPFTDDYQTTMLLASLVPVLFVFAFGACVGSLLNVVVYRLPLGLDIVSPPSRCPSCATRLTWRENIPIFGWLLLGGRCRFCRSRVSVEYPIVELVVALLFSAVFVVWYLLPGGATLLGLPIGQMKPDWALGNGGWGGEWVYFNSADFGRTWPLLVAVLTMLSCLVAMTLIDARTCTIPLELPWLTTIVALAAHVGLAVYLQVWTLTGALPGMTGRVPGEDWAIPSSGSWWWVGATLGAAIGLVISLVLVRVGLLKRSYADFDDWVAQQERGEGSAAPVDDGAPSAMSEEASAPPATTPAAPEARAATLVGASLLGALAGALVALVLAPRLGTSPALAALVGSLGGSLVGALCLRLVEARTTARTLVHGEPLAQPVLGESAAVDARDASATSPAEAWLAYPHARRETVRELAFLGPCVALAYVGGTVATALSASAGDPPALWLRALIGVLMGYLIGAGVVWGVRILGSLLFGKEAMGLGDVHLMGGVGATIGWIDATLAFFLAAIVGTWWTILGGVAGGGRGGRALPFGPHLAVASLLVLALKPATSWFIRDVLNAPVP
jgi:leader peptidase (prepilin peptidase)/N-methyltransferase